MRLLWSSRSPFARKVMIAAHELGLADRIQTERVIVNSIKPNDQVMLIHPLSKIPTLVLDDGTALFDSRVIIEYLANVAGDAKLLPRDARRWTVLTTQSLGDAIMEADLRWIDERNREPQFRLDAQIEACRTKINSGLDALEADMGFGADGTADVGSIAVGTAIAHLDFRFPELEWRKGRSRLANWHAGFSLRPSMVATAFAETY